MNGLFVHWSRGWGVLSFSERLVNFYKVSNVTYVSMLFINDKYHFSAICQPDHCAECSDPDTCTKCETGHSLAGDGLCTGEFTFSFAWNENSFNSLRVRKQKHILTFYFIPPYWHGTGSWNPSSSKTRTHLLYIINIMGADVLATQGARAPATMIFTMLNRIPARFRGLWCWLLCELFSSRELYSMWCGLFTEWQRL